MKRGKWILKGIAMGIVFIVLAGGVTMLLWNWLVPSLFHGPEIRFVQALGLLLLSKILFSGWGGRRCGGGGRWRHGYYNKWSSMTPEERERFKNRLREKWCTPHAKEAQENPPTSNV